MSHFTWSNNLFFLSFNAHGAIYLKLISQPQPFIFRSHYSNPLIYISIVRIILVFVLSLHLFFSNASFHPIFFYLNFIGHPPCLLVIEFGNLIICLIIRFAVSILPKILIFIWAFYFIRLVNLICFLIKISKLIYNYSFV